LSFASKSVKDDFNLTDYEFTIIFTFSKILVIFAALISLISDVFGRNIVYMFSLLFYIIICTGIIISKSKEVFIFMAIMVQVSCEAL